jgi:hypothetical protein
VKMCASYAMSLPTYEHRHDLLKTLSMQSIAAMQIMMNNDLAVFTRNLL